MNTQKFRVLRYLSVVAASFVCIQIYASTIDREQVVMRNNPHVVSADTLASLTVGNGHFAFTADITGLQTFPEYYSGGVPLGTMSDWGWHSFPNDSNFTASEALVERDFGRGHTELYSAEFRQPGRQRNASNYLRQNPHRLHLGCVGLALDDVSAISDADETLDMWNGLIDSRFQYKGRPYHVQTVCSPYTSLIASKVESKGAVDVRIRVPYPTGKHSDDGCDWGEDRPQTLRLTKGANCATINVAIDSISYDIIVSWRGQATIETEGNHSVLLSGEDVLDFTVEWNLGGSSGLQAQVTEGFEQVRQAAADFWHDYWNKGGIADFSHVSDPRGQELERRVVLSQYLLAVNDGGDTPPQETGLTYNSWFGKFHLEMIWWHQAQFALWGHPEILERSLRWYFKVREKAGNIASRQGFFGVRWMKMTDPSGEESPSNVGSYLIWQQPHIIYLAELLYRCQTSEEGRERILQIYAPLVEETARFMASFATYDAPTNRYVLKGCIPAQETLKAETTVNPPLELSYWHWGLGVAQSWRKRLGKSRNVNWDEVGGMLPPLAFNSDSLYLAAESATDTYTDIRMTSDHPAITGAVGMLPHSDLVDNRIMLHTLDWIEKHWNWDKTWGWDFPMVAMCYARMGNPEKAVDALLMPHRTNTYLPNGHNYQDSRLRCYLPGNGGLLTAVAMMLAGWDGAKVDNPGFPSAWNVRWEGLLPLP